MRKLRLHLPTTASVIVQHRWTKKTNEVDFHLEKENSWNWHGRYVGANTLWWIPPNECANSLDFLDIWLETHNAKTCLWLFEMSFILKTPSKTKICGRTHTKIRIDSLDLSHKSIWGGWRSHVGELSMGPRVEGSEFSRTHKRNWETKGNLDLHPLTQIHFGGMEV